MTGRCRRAAGVLLAAVLLGGCATRPPADAAQPWVSGRLWVQVDAWSERPASNVSAGFDLRGDGRQGELRLSTPLGTMLAATRWSPSGVVLDRGQGEVGYADMDTLSQQVLGEALPLQAFPDWVAGRPWAGAPAAVLAGGFEQLGWVVSLADRAQGRLQAVRAAPPRVTVRVHLEGAAP